MRNNKDTHNELTTGSWFIRIGPAAGLHSVLTLNSNGGWVLCLRATTVDDSVKGNESLVSEKQSVWKINTQKVINFRVLGISRSRHAHTRTRCVRFVTQLRKIFFFSSQPTKNVIKNLSWIVYRRYHVNFYLNKFLSSSTRLKI